MLVNIFSKTCIFFFRFITKVPGVLYIKQINENDAGEYRYII